MLHLKKIIGCGLLLLLCNGLYAKCEGEEVKQAFIETMLEIAMEEDGMDKNNKELRDMMSSVFMRMVRISFVDTEELQGDFFGNKSVCRSTITFVFDPSVLGQPGKAEESTRTIEYEVLKENGKTRVKVNKEALKAF